MEVNGGKWVYLEGLKGGYWRLKSGLAVPAVAKRLEGNRGRTEAVETYICRLVPDSTTEYCYSFYRGHTSSGGKLHRIVPLSLSLRFPFPPFARGV